eukprot:TRINITY_DN2397_c0_g1_i1.p1 TRINITY_DN2397_c0_g1~~TRINITY_DN2397_c0_g1_i1.p1  ORF type:complete len:228 (-),score=61.14 TRINITY_DN2397_c0_g1_i1:602-1237(-)
MDDVTVLKKIVYGNYARFLTEEELKNAPQDHVYYWRVFVRGYNDEDISKWVQKISFVLHESFDPQVRSCLTPPYEISETGFGTFPILIQLDLKDTPKTLEFVTYLNFPMQGEKTYEVLDEITFKYPPPSLIEKLNAHKTKTETSDRTRTSSQQDVTLQSIEINRDEKALFNEKSRLEFINQQRAFFTTKAVEIEKENEKLKVQLDALRARR